MKTVKRICTHSGVFHSDDVTACMMLTKYTKEFLGAEIHRSRDRKVWETMDLVVDVGGVYNPSKHRYDHHQKGFMETFNDKSKTKLSGCGLIFKHFGKEIIRNALVDVFKSDTSLSKYQKEISDKDVTTIMNSVYEYFVEQIDAVDNGINQYPKDIKPAYKSNGTSLDSRIY